MFTIKCKTENAITLTELRQFQGNLKKRSENDVNALINSLNEDGLLMPFAIWKQENGGICSILDGHARYEAMIRMAIDDPVILNTPLPVIFIENNDENEAKRALLQITSAYGHITKKGLLDFTATIPNYTPVAPIAVKVMTPVSVKKQAESDTVVLRLSVKKDMVAKLTEVLGSVEGVNIL
jgi:hypothetical protein